MKLKQDSLLDKIKQENLSNPLLNENKDLIPKLKPNTDLTNKLSLINQLYKLNTKDSLNQISEIINSSFKYSYPFHFETNGVDSLEKTEYIKEETLIKHIRREVELNKLEPEFNSINSLIKEKRKLDSSGFPKEGLIAGIVIALFGLFLAYNFNTSMLNMRVKHAGHSFLKLIGIIVSYASYGAFPFFGFMAGPFLLNNKNKTVNLENRIKRDLSRIKTKANTVYN